MVSLGFFVVLQRIRTGNKYYQINYVTSGYVFLVFIVPLNQIFSLHRDKKQPHVVTTKTF